MKAMRTNSFLTPGTKPVLEVAFCGNKCVTIQTILRHDNVLVEDPAQAGRKHWNRSKVGVLGEASHRASHHLCEETCDVMHASLFIFILVSLRGVSPKQSSLKRHPPIIEIPRLNEQRESRIFLCLTGDCFVVAPRRHSSQ
jgi:hypothetical protein